MADDTSRETNEETNDGTDALLAAASDDAPATESRLSQLEDFEVDDGYPDIRGWPVRGSNGLELGVVGDLLVDTALLEVSALDVHLGVGAAGMRGNVVGSARVPIESAQLRKDRYVVVDVDVIPCEDVLVMPADDGSGTMRRVPCGQIGIRRRSEAQGAGAVAREVEVARPVVEGDASVAAPVAGEAARGTPARTDEALHER